MQNIHFDWDEKTGTCGCTLKYKDKCFIGFALCHPDDIDMKNKLMGQIIAEGRATARCLQHIRDNELKPQLRALKQLYYSMNKSKHFNPKSYENIMLYRQIRFLENDLIAIKEELARIKQNIKEYISQKENDHKLIRKYLKKKATLVEKD